MNLYVSHEHHQRFFQTRLATLLLRMLAVGSFPVGLKSSEILICSMFHL